MEKYYITSDLHFGHKNILKYCPNSRIFSSVEEMNESILSQIDEFPEGSTLINCGDLFINSRISFDEVKSIIDRMKSNNKTLWIIMGNHDRELAKRMKSDKSSIEILYALGFDRVYEYPILLDGKYLLSHEPVYLNQHSNIKQVYGHVHGVDITEDYFIMEYEHSSSKNKSIEENTYINLDNYMNVCWDKHKRILNFSEVREYFK